MERAQSRGSIAGRVSRTSPLSAAILQRAASAVLKAHVAQSSASKSGATPLSARSSASPSCWFSFLAVSAPSSAFPRFCLYFAHSSRSTGVIRSSSCFFSALLRCVSLSRKHFGGFDGLSMQSRRDMLGTNTAPVDGGETSPTRKMVASIMLRLWSAEGPLLDTFHLPRGPDEWWVLWYPPPPISGFQSSAPRPRQNV